MITADLTSSFDLMRNRSSTLDRETTNASFLFPQTTKVMNTTISFKDGVWVESDWKKSKATLLKSYAPPSVTPKLPSVVDVPPKNRAFDLSCS